MPSTLLVKIKNDINEMIRLREAVQKFAEQIGLSQEVLFALDLSLEELVTNVIFYGFDDDKEHSISVELQLLENLLIMEIQDEGRPFDPTQKEDPRLDVPLEERQIGGLGIHLVRNYMDSMRYRRDGNRNILTLEKRI